MYLIFLLSSLMNLKTPQINPDLPIGLNDLTLYNVVYNVN